MNALSMISIKIIHTKGVMMSPDIKQKKCKNNGTSWVIWSLFLGLPSAMGGFYLALIIAITLCVWKCSLNWKCSRMKACECHSSRRLHCFPGRNIFYALIKSLCSQSTLKFILHTLTVWHLWSTISSLFLIQVLFLGVYFLLGILVLQDDEKDSNILKTYLLSKVTTNYWRMTS